MNLKNKIMGVIFLIIVYVYRNFPSKRWFTCDLSFLLSYRESTQKIINLRVYKTSSCTPLLCHNLENSQSVQYHQ